MTLLAVALLSGIGLDLLNPQILRAFIDTAAQGGTIEQWPARHCCSSAWR